MYKDEISAGVDWQFSQNWVFNSQVVWSEMGDLSWSTDQFDANGNIVTDIRNWDDGFRKYRGLILELNRAFRNGWALRSNYTLGKSEGNVDFVVDDDDLFEALGGVEVGTGRTDATIVNREGRNQWDREQLLNLVGLKRWEIGNHDIGVGAYYFYRAGARWGLRPTRRSGTRVGRDHQHPHLYRAARQESARGHLLGQPHRRVVVPDPRQRQAKIGGEVSNLTDEQEVVDINIATGDPTPGSSPTRCRASSG